MKNLFPYQRPDPGKKEALKNRLMKEHRKLYGSQETSFFAKYRLLFMSPLYALILMTLGLGSLFSVQAFTSPVAQIYGEIYGFSAQFQIGVQQTLANLNLADKPLLPGLTPDETSSYISSSNSTEKILLTSKIGRALPASIQNKIRIPDTSETQVLHKNNTGISLESIDSSSLKITWNEQLLPSGALPLKYIVERSLENTTSWENMSEQIETSFIDKNIPHAETLYYQIKIVDWQGNTSSILPFVEFIPDFSIPPEELEEPVQPILPSVSIPVNTRTSSNSSTAEPRYDFEDEAQPLLDLQLQVVPELKTINQFKLIWKSTFETKGYNVYRDNLKRNISLLKTTTFIDTDIKPGKAYQYQIRLVGEDGKEIGKSTKVQITFPFIPQSPGDIEAYSSETGTVLHWKPVVVTGLKGYILYRKNVSTGEEISLKIKGTSYEDKQTDAETLYQYSVSAELISGLQSPRSISIQIQSP